MYLTQFTINPARRGAQKLLSSPQAMHAAVLASFPPPPERAAPGGSTAGAAESEHPRILWRIDTTTKTTTRLYISSPTAPDLTHLVEQAGWPTTETWQTRDYTPLLERLDHGQRWGFRLKANPVHAVRLQTDKRTQPIGHVTIAQQEAWLETRSEKNGFTLNEPESSTRSFAVHSRETLRFRRRTGVVTLTTATYEGILTISDPAAIRRAMTSGIGRAKGYGCGMLTLAPVP